jgi:hypothetical protein
MGQASRKEFLELQRHWYGILKAEEFPDCEQLINGELVLKQGSGASYRPKKGGSKESALERECKRDYFEMISDFCNLQRYRNRIEKLIMFRVADGARNCEISRELREIGDPICKGYRQTIMFIIRHYENLWGIKNWKPEQMRVKRWVKKPHTA